MSQIEIVEIIEQIKQEIQVNANGQGKASVRAAARLAGVDEKAIRSSLDSAELKPSRLAIILAEHGFHPAELREWKTNGIPDIAIAIILDYYAHEAGRYCTKQARLVCKAFNTIGVRAWIQDILGWVKPPTVQQPQSPIEIILQNAQNLVAIAQQLFEQDCRQRELEQAILAQQNLNQQLQHRLKAVEVEQDRVNTPCGHKYSVVGFANLQGLEISVKEAGAKGRKASALCRKQGIEIERIHDPRFGKVGLYPESILVEVFKAEHN
ncbi:hypothetical protein GNF10_24120 [Nostoc sp. UCD121]|uniref:hypothetical protein n=1 Tax=unclassified Nostoc TaxID=2593658 RepID=UPI00162AF7C8|nr:MULTISPECIES: hypothetical protein [unclassified Nostoc]MBC1221433.1 hypothetical protein [Nostoc sp. UCD120]MBC1278968.1 hypothetical protein [Nostoc sp. UCD121]MBC1296405.1 hypothetical protein [Nostoc sp. UCD122]